MPKDPLDLHHLVARAIFKRRRDEAVKSGLGYVGTIPRQFYEDADAILEAFKTASGDERHAILRLLGFDVHEGWVHRRRLSISYDRPADRYLDEYTRVFVPRDQRETT